MKKQNILTIACISAFSFMLAIALHEQVGHGLATVLQGGHIQESNAFYIDVAAKSLSAFGHRLEALAGPLMNLLCAGVALLLLGVVRKKSVHGGYFLWHFMTVNLMIAFGYLIFSGFTGLGDLGFDKDGVFYGFGEQQGWLQIAFIATGFAAYYGLIRLSIKKIQEVFDATGASSVAEYQKMATVAYLSGVAAALLIGAFNPNGLIIVVISAAASSVFGTSGLLWMMQLIDRKAKDKPMQRVVSKDMRWIILSLVFVASYGLIFARSLYF